MDIHKNARLTPHGRERLAKMILGGQTPQAASEAGGVCPRTARKWVDRFNQEGLAGLQDRKSRPHWLRQPTPQPVIDRIEALRRQRMPGKEIATQVGVSAATVSRVLKRLGLNKLSALEPAEPPRRYERERPGELIHIDIKKLGRFDQIGHRITGDRTGQSNARGVGWSSAMSASTMPRASPSPRSSRTSESKVPSPSSRPPSPTMQASASPSNAS
jgi:transposase